MHVKSWPLFLLALVFLLTACDIFSDETPVPEATLTPAAASEDQATAVPTLEAPDLNATAPAYPPPPAASGQDAAYPPPPASGQDVAYPPPPAQGEDPAYPPPAASGQDAAYPPPAAEGPCLLLTQADVTAYQRPSTEAQVFGTVTAGMTIEALGVTADGWLGFDPGVAQAANTGVLRLRWVQPEDDYTMQGACDSLPEQPSIPPGVCFFMPMTDTPIYTFPDLSFALITTMVPDDYAAVKGTAGPDWYGLDLSVGSVGIAQEGYIPASAANFNGQCDALPDVTPS